MVHIDLSFIGRDLSNRLQRTGREMASRILRPQMEKAVRIVQSISRRDYLSGPRPSRLGVRTGRLRGSITTSVSAGLGTRQIEGRVGTNVVYGPIHEYGGTIRAKRGRFLRFRIGRRWVAVRRVTIPPRPFLRTALRDAAPKIMLETGLAVSGELERL